MPKVKRAKTGKADRRARCFLCGGPYLSPFDPAEHPPHARPVCARCVAKILVQRARAGVEFLNNATGRKT